MHVIFTVVHIYSVKINHYSAKEHTQKYEKKNFFGYLNLLVIFSKILYILSCFLEFPCGLNL